MNNVRICRSAKQKKAKKAWNWTDKRKITFIQFQLQFVCIWSIKVEMYKHTQNIGANANWPHPYFQLTPTQQIQLVWT